MKKIISLLIAFIMLFSIPTMVYSVDHIYGDDPLIVFYGEYGKINITLEDAKEYTLNDFDCINARMIVQNYPTQLEVYIEEKTKSATDAAVDSIRENLNGNIKYIDPDYKFGYAVSGVVPGDANGDFMLNLSDVSLTLKYIAGWNTPVHFTANVNNDNIINLDDISITLKRIAGWDN